MHRTCFAIQEGGETILRSALTRANEWPGPEYSPRPNPFLSRNPEPSMSRVKPDCVAKHPVCPCARSAAGKIEHMRKGRPVFPLAAHVAETVESPTGAAAGAIRERAGLVKVH